MSLTTLYWKTKNSQGAITGGTNARILYYDVSEITNRNRAFYINTLIINIITGNCK
jgi:hypothetical protein